MKYLKPHSYVHFPLIPSISLLRPSSNAATYPIMKSNFCLDNKGQLYPCSQTDNQSTTTTPAPSFTDAIAAANTDIVQRQSNSYSTLDYHPQTLMLSGMATLMILIVLAVCFCGYKKLCNMVRAPAHMLPPAAGPRLPQPNPYAAPRF